MMLICDMATTNLSLILQGSVVYFSSFLEETMMRRRRKRKELVTEALVSINLTSDLNYAKN